MLTMPTSSKKLTGKPLKSNLPFDHISIHFDLNRDVKSVINDDKWLQEEFVAKVQKRVEYLFQFL